MTSRVTFKYMQNAVRLLHRRGAFANAEKYPFRPTQKAGFKAYNKYLQDTSLTMTARKSGAFLIPTGVGKTAMFASVTGEFYKQAWKANYKNELYTVVVSPTTNLLGQTHDEFLEYAPHLEGMIGLYGDGHKDWDKSVTIMTYNAWVTQVEAGNLGAFNTDLLISDEAHRGLSVRRQQNLFNAFNHSGSFRLAFTATGQFDRHKTVEKTHGNIVFEENIARAVELGDLAKYIQTQLYIVRIDPNEKSFTREYNGRNGSEAPDNVVYELKKSAWNQRVVEIYKQARDERTGQLLTDNQAGFFVADTAQADDLEERLNSDSVLRRRAREMGYEHVAMAVHTKGMNKAEQKRRMDLYKDGKVMAVIGDEKFKEGFDHAPMKTVIDWPHGSLVDKAQILGRGARKFGDIGLTFVDTIVYVGDKDPTRDLELRDRAIRDAVLANEILENDIVLSPSARQQIIAPIGSSDDVERIYIEGVEAFASLEDVREIMERRRRLIEDLDFEYTIEDVLEAAKLFLLENGNRPSSASGKIKHGYLEGITWGSINQKIDIGSFNRLGYRSLADFLDKHAVGLKEDFTLEMVLDSAEKYLKKYRRRPSRHSEKVTSGPLKGKTWGSVDLMIVKGSLSSHGFSSLSDFLDQKGVGVVTINQIIEAAEKYYNKHGVRPSAVSTEAPDSMVINITWRGLDSKIKEGSLSGQGYNSLSDLLNKKQIGTQKTSIEDILRAAQLHFKKYGERPHQRSGAVKLGKLKGKLWGTLDKSIKDGNLSNKGYESLFDLLKKNKIGDLHCVDYNIQDIENAILAYIADHGKKPNQKSGKIPYPPFNDQMRWGGINTSNVLKKAGCTSMPDFIKKRNIVVPKSDNGFSPEP